MPTIIEKPKVEIDPEILAAFKSQVHEAGQVVIHCVSQDTYGWGMQIRIWPTTFLYAHESSHRSEMIHVENITLAPVWQVIPPQKKLHYSLIFSGLPKNCNRFDLIEHGKGPNCFSALDIARNNSDVYYVRLG